MFCFTSIYTEIQHTTGLAFSYVEISATVLLDVWFVINGRLASETTVKKKFHWLDSHSITRNLTRDLAHRTVRFTTARLGGGRGRL